MRIGEIVYWTAYVTEERVNSRIKYFVEFPIYRDNKSAVEQKKSKIGDISNDFLCLFKPNNKNLKKAILDENRLSNWFKCYHLPPLQKTSLEDGEFQIISPQQDNIPEYCETLEQRWNQAISIIQNIQNKKDYGMILHVDIEHSWSGNLHRIRYFFINDIYPLILFDIFRASQRYVLQTCPICGSFFFPVDGRERCVGCEKPISKLSNSELSDNEIEVNHQLLSNSNERKALLRKLQRQDKSHKEINAIFDKYGYKNIRDYHKGDD